LEKHSTVIANKEKRKMKNKMVEHVDGNESERLQGRIIHSVANVHSNNGSKQG